MRLIAALLLALAVSLPAAAAGKDVVAITGGVIVDPASDGPGAVGTVLVRNGRIAAVGPTVRVPRGARVVDAAGRYVLPGLWDMHAHLLAGAPLDHRLEGYVGHGVLGIRDMGGYPDQLLALRKEISAGRLGPELVMAGPTLNGESFAGFQRVIATPEAARAAVRELKAAGFDIIKTHRATKPEVFLALADEARRQSMPLVGHVPLGVTWIEAAEAGMQSLEHAQTILESEMADPRAEKKDLGSAITRLDGGGSAAIFAAMARRGTYFDPTVIFYERSFAKAEPGLKARRAALYGWLKPLVGRAAKAGVPILAGTDALETPGDLLLTELERLAEAGLTPRQALRAATSTAAKAVGRPELGAIRKGAPAFLIVVDADPTADVRNLRRLSTVILHSRVLDADMLAALRAADTPPQDPGDS